MRIQIQKSESKEREETRARTIFSGHIWTNRLGYTSQTKPNQTEQVVMPIDVTLATGCWLLMPKRSNKRIALSIWKIAHIMALYIIVHILRYMPYSYPYPYLHEALMSFNKSNKTYRKIDQHWMREWRFSMFIGPKGMRDEKMRLKG